jgi:pimeloyl-ACP methyl ester carboxylesterase
MIIRHFILQLNSNINQSYSAKFIRKLRLGAVVYFLSFYISCVTVTNMDQDIITKPIYKIEQKPPKGPKKAIVVLLHGLNLKPERMDDWAQKLSFHGSHVISFALYGHGDDKNHMAKVTANIWREQIDEAILLAQKKALGEVPVYFLGFSLGALVGLEALSRHPNAIFQKMVLIAPALSTPWYSRGAIKALSIFGKGFILPSRSPKEYRAHKGTSIAAYQALFELLDSVMAHEFKNANVSTLLLIDQHDELVDSKDIRKIIWDYKLSQWQLEIVDNRYAYDTYGFRHLMVDEESVGQELWEHIANMVINHLGL